VDWWNTFVRRINDDNDEINDNVTRKRRVVIFQRLQFMMMLLTTMLVKRGIII
jgi:hypothetical protein